jgi:hypothetical protein
MGNRGSGAHPVLELGRAGLAVQVEKSLSVIYESAVVGDFTPDLLVERVIVVELKAVQATATPVTTPFILSIHRLPFLCILSKNPPS